MRLLLAEDEHELSDALCAILKHNHYSVDPVYDGQEALDYIRHGQYDGAILDIMMPKMDGLTVLRQVRESPCSRGVSWLFCRAVRMRISLRRGFRALRMPSNGI